MIRKSVFSGALAPLLLAGPAWADFRAPILGAMPMLPARFSWRPPLPPSFTAGLQLGSLELPIPGSRATLPARFVVALTPRALLHVASVRRPDAISAIDERRLRALVPSPSLWSNSVSIAWRAPLFERKLSEVEKTLPLAGELIEAVSRIEPMFDPTRLDGPDTLKPMAVSAGTASMDSVFADRWHRASGDPNINAKVDAIALAWRPARPFSCEDLTKTRPRRLGELALTGLNEAECRAAQARARGADLAPDPISIAEASVPVFAAPLPGSRLSSADFWAKRKERIAAVQAQLRERQAQEAIKIAFNPM